MIQRTLTMITAGALACGTFCCGAGGETGGTGGTGGTSSVTTSTAGTGGWSSETSSTSAATSGSGTGGSTSGAYNKLWIPDTISGKTFDLTLSESSRQFQAGAKTTTFGYNGADFWGPTLIMNKGDLVQMHITRSSRSARPASTLSGPSVPPTSATAAWPGSGLKAAGPTI